jgi:hypothetical protein
MSDHKTFCAFGAYAVNVIDPAATVLMLLANKGEQANAITNDKLVTLDLSKRLGEAGVAWEEVLMDNMGFNRDLTPKEWLGALERPENEDGIDVHTIGPLFLGTHIGGIYIERTKFYAEIRPRLDPNHQLWPDSGRHTYQFMSSALRTNDRISRYHGFHATVIESVDSIKVLRIRRPRPPIENIVVEVDLNHRMQCDDPELLINEIQDPHRPEREEVPITADSKPGAQGAVFLALRRCAELNLNSYKEPPGGG